MRIVWVKLGQASVGDNEAKLMMRLAPEWVRTSDPVIRSPARYRWTTAHAFNGPRMFKHYHYDISQYTCAYQSRYNMFMHRGQSGEINDET